MDTIPYNWTIPFLTYDNDDEYRRHIRTAFNLPQKNNIDTTTTRPTPTDTTYDDPDELDPKEMDVLMETTRLIYEKTQAHPLFATLYEHAAAKMMSISPQTGVVVLFSFDYFTYFHSCLVEYFVEKKAVFPAYEPLYQLLTTRHKTNIGFNEDVPI